jgi:hypothetical protein
MTVHKGITSQKRADKISKILKYANQILNIEVEFVDQKKLGSDAGGYVAPKGQCKGKITISNEYNGLTTILILLHEIGHHIDFLKRGYVEDEDAAYQYYPDVRNTYCPLKHRRLIRSVENYAIKYAYELSIFLDLKLPALAYLKDEIYTKSSLELIFKNGPLNKDEMRKLKKKSKKQARLLLRTEYGNKKILPLIKKS